MYMFSWLESISTLSKVNMVSLAFSEAFIRGQILFSFTSQKFKESESRFSPPLKRIDTLIESPSNRSVSKIGDSRSGVRD